MRLKFCQDKIHVDLDIDVRLRFQKLKKLKKLKKGTTFRLNSWFPFRVELCIFAGNTAWLTLSNSAENADGASVVVSQGLLIAIKLLNPSM